MEYTENTMIAIDEAMQDDEFTAKLAQAADAAEIKAIFLARGIEIDDVTAEAAFAKMESIARGDELTAEDLELVAGGCKNCYYSCTLAGAALGGLVGGPGGIIIGAAVGSIIGVGVAVRHDIKRWRKR